MKRVLAAAVLVALACMPAGASAEQTTPLYRFAILSDRTGGHNPGVYQRVIDEINLLHPDFVVTVGDHIEGYGQDYDRSYAEWDSVMAMIGGLNAPVYMIPGNHDIWDDQAELIWKEKTGFDPYYSFDYGNTHFVVLDNSRFDVSADFPPEQMEWLVDDLSRHDEAERTFVFYHKPLWAQTLVLGKPDALHDVFVEHGVDAVFNGHLHTYFSADFDEVQYTVMGSSGGVMYRASQQPVARGEFFQFGWVTVTEHDHELAVIHLGSVYPRDVVTTDDVAEIESIEGGLVSIGPIRVADQSSVRAPVEVTIENATGAMLDDTIRWNVPEGWMVEPEEAAVSVEPGSTGVYTFVMSNPGDLYPTPTMTCRYPLSNGRVLDVDMAASVVKSAHGSIASEPPIIDGDLSDACWSDCSPVSNLHAPYEAEVEGDTEFSFACDADNLYLSVICRDPSMVDMTAEIEERDGPIYAEDCVGYFLQPNPDEMTVYQIYVNPLGTIFDQRITFDDKMWYTADRDWDGDYDVATQRMDDRWSVEMKIPFATLGGDARSHPVWRANFRRKQARTGAAADWQLPIDYNPGTFGELTFE